MACMSADQVAEIAPGIRESIAGGDALCATFTITGDSSRWVQFVGGVINAAYPYPTDPAAFITQLGAGVVESYEAGQYVTVRMTTVDVDAIARWIDAYFEQALGALSNYSVHCRLERL